MNFLYPFIAILGESAAKTIDKLNFSKNHIPYRLLMLLTFIAMTASLLLFIILTRQSFPAISLVSFGLIALIALASFGGNLFDYLSLKANDLSLREPMVDFDPILAGLVGYVLIPSERKVAFLIAFIIGAVIVYWGTHQRRLRHFQKRGMFYCLLAALLYAFLPSIYQLTLVYISPSYIAFFRVAAILIFTIIFLPVKKITKSLSSSKLTYSFLAGLVYSIEAIASLYAIKTLGVVLTMILLMLGPALRYLASSFILKEKVRKQEVISSLLLAGVVLISIFIQW